MPTSWLDYSQLWVEKSPLVFVKYNICDRLQTHTTESVVLPCFRCDVRPLVAGNGTAWLWRRFEEMKKWRNTFQFNNEASGFTWIHNTERVISSDEQHRQQPWPLTLRNALKAHGSEASHIETGSWEMKHELTNILAPFTLWALNIPYKNLFAGRLVNWKL